MFGWRQVLWHVVLIKFRDEVSQRAKNEIFERYQSLSQKCGGTKAGIVSFRVEWNLDLRKGVELVEIVIFTDNDALQRFRMHPEHILVANMLSKIANWQVGDFIAPFSPEERVR